MALSLSDLDALQANIERGKTKSKSKVVWEDEEVAIEPKQAKKTYSSKEKNHIEWVLKDSRLPYVKEHLFWPGRRFRYDFAIVKLKIAIEYEGIFAGKSRHTTVTGYTQDVIKYNESAILGWKVLRYTAKNYKNVADDLKRLLKSLEDQKFEFY